MKMFICISILLSVSAIAYPDENGPWGEAKEATSIYKPQRVLYDVTTGNEKTIVEILDRISYLNNLYGNDPFDSSIVVVLHGLSIPFFTKAVFKKYKNIVTRAQSLTVGSTIEFRMCQTSAKLQGFKPNDIHGFIKMVPMADAEIIQLQIEGYAYMR